MEILNIGPLEFLLILVIALIVLGPRDMVRTGQKIGQFIRKVIQSPAWQQMMNASREIREMPTRLIRDTGLENDLQEIKSNTQIGLGLDSLDPVNLHSIGQDLKTTAIQSLQISQSSPDPAEEAVEMEPVEPLNTEAEPPADPVPDEPGVQDPQPASPPEGD
jgi:Sec-independent protein translocase protein TatA